jgi:hypothetical protein
MRSSSSKTGALRLERSLDSTQRIAFGPQASEVTISESSSKVSEMRRTDSLSGNSAVAV